jgi:SAM-dependent methyltransferase
MVKHLDERAKRDGLENLTAIAGLPDDPRLPEKVDVVLLVDVYHHLSDPERYFRNLRSALKPGARVAIIDFDQRSPIGPPPSERLSPGEVEAAMVKAGYTLVKSNTFLPNQYYLVFQPGKA